jgi:hypothetical protein
VRTFERIPSDAATHSINDFEQVVQLARRGPLVVDLETAGLGSDAWTLTAIVAGTGSTAVVLDPRLGATLAAVREALSVTPEIVVHNAPFDIPLWSGWAT